jgi:RNA polymerase sigma-54 factor
MGMEMKLQYKLAQQLVMTPQLVQAIKLLQLSRMELIDEVRKELDQNPVLADDGTDPRGREADPTAPTMRTTDVPPEERVGMTERVEADTDMAAKGLEKQVKEVDWEQFLENRQLQTPMPTSGRGGNDEMPPIEASLTKPQTLRDHLLWQLQMSDFVDNERHFALLVIGNLDERGYLDLERGVGPDGEKLPDITIEELAAEAELDPDFARKFLTFIISEVIRNHETFQK